ncbi:MAG: hypothetical protein NT155_03690 [Candidatus Staskawiczbacteria bacterium]|nr:hypothetical protein [Candidatus Staskawiczbacteria bacterium]
MFKPIQFDSGKLLSCPVGSTQTIAKGDALIWSSGLLVVATNTSLDIFAIAMQDSASQASGTLILVLPVAGVRFEADTDDVVSTVDRGCYADLATLATVNPDATTYKVFLIDEIVGTVEVTKIVRGTFCRLKAAT